MGDDPDMDRRRGGVERTLTLKVPQVGCGRSGDWGSGWWCWPSGFLWWSGAVPVIAASPGHAQMGICGWPLGWAAIPWLWSLGALDLWAAPLAAPAHRWVPGNGGAYCLLALLLGGKASLPVLLSPHPPAPPPPAHKHVGPWGRCTSWGCGRGGH